MLLIGKEKAVYHSGYEKVDGVAELTEMDVKFHKNKSRAGIAAMFGLIGMLLSSKHEELLSIPRKEITGVSLEGISTVLIAAPKGETKIEFASDTVAKRFVQAFAEPL